MCTDDEDYLDKAIKSLYEKFGCDVLSTMSHICTVLNTEGADIAISVPPSMDAIQILDLRSPQYAHIAVGNNNNNDSNVNTSPPSAQRNECGGTACKKNNTTGVQPVNDTDPSVFLTAQPMFKSWGVRHRNTLTGRKTKKEELFISPSQRSTRAHNEPVLPHSAVHVDPTARPPSQRSQGGYTATPPYWRTYGYYKRFGGAGYGAKTSHHHGFPVGAAPAPETVYSG
jgi:hypothetical protein